MVCVYGSDPVVVFCICGMRNEMFGYHKSRSEKDHNSNRNNRLNAIKCLTIGLKMGTLTHRCAQTPKQKPKCNKLTNNMDKSEPFDDVFVLYCQLSSVI